MLKFSGKKNTKRRAKVEKGEGLKVEGTTYVFHPFRKTQPTYAVPIREPFEVDTLEGLHKGKAGDYLAVGAAGEMYPINKAVFESTYEQYDSKAPETPRVCVHCNGRVIEIIGQQLTPGILPPYKHAAGSGKGCPRQYGPLSEEDVRPA